VVHYATRPVLGLRGGRDAWPPGRVVIGDDGSETARKAAELAVSIGKLCGAREALVRAYAEMPEIDAGGRISDSRLVDDALRRAERELEKHAEKLERTLGMRPRVEVAVGDAAAALLEKARKEGETSTLIVVGRRGLGLAKRLRMGSASTKVLRAAEGPVLVHPGAGRAIL
jgi:nucleotide-binding universal stress UspA family protein